MLTINLATRGRPELLRRTVSMTVKNMVLPDTQFVLSIDDDDQRTIDSMVHLPSDKRIIPLVMPREDSLGAKYNRVLSFAPADIYLAMVDYAPHLTPGFDEKIIEAGSLFPDNIGVVYNHMANASFPNINAVTSGLVQKMGFLYPPYFSYWFIDHWLDDIARLIDRVSFADVRIDTSMRPGTMEKRETEFWTTFFDCGQRIRRKNARDIIESPEFLDPAWRKDILKRHFPLIEYRSQWVNAVVREESRAEVSAAPDERYIRLKDQAKALAQVWLDEIKLQLAA